MGLSVSTQPPCVPTPMPDAQPLEGNHWSQTLHSLSCWKWGVSGWAGIEWCHSCLGNCLAGGRRATPQSEGEKRTEEFRQEGCSVWQRRISSARPSGLWPLEAQGWVGL